MAEFGGLECEGPFIIDLDGSSSYLREVFRNLASCSATEQWDFRSLFHFATVAKNGTKAERYALLIAQGGLSQAGTPGQTKRHIDNLQSMIYRWALDFLTKLDDHAAKRTKGLLSLV